MNKATKETFRDGLTIEYAEYGWFISCMDGKLYLHKDGTLHQYCGEENFFPTYGKAARFLIDLEEYLIPDSYEVILNEKYTAIVTKNSIKVGCQSFPVSILKGLQDAYNKLN